MQQIAQVLLHQCIVIIPVIPSIILLVMRIMMLVTNKNHSHHIHPIHPPIYNGTILKHIKLWPNMLMTLCMHCQSQPLHICAISMCFRQTKNLLNQQKKNQAHDSLNHRYMLKFIHDYRVCGIYLL